MAESRFVQSTEAPEAVSVNERTRRYVLSQERDKGFASEIRDGRHASAAGGAAALLPRDHDEAFRPAALSQILLASFFGGEHRLEFTQSLRKHWARHAPILMLGAC